MARKYPSMNVMPELHADLKRAARAQGMKDAAWLDHAIREQINRENNDEQPRSRALYEQYVCNLREEVDKQQRRGNYWQRECARLRAENEALRLEKEALPQERGPSLLPVYGTAAS